jgi:transglutaminase-like putative cysteine protease
MQAPCPEEGTVPQKPIRVLAVLLGFLMAAGIASAATPGAPPVAPNRRFEFTYTVRVPATSGRELRLWVPLPHNDTYQTISALRIVSPIPYRVARFAQGNEDAYFALSGAQLRNPTTIQIHFLDFRREHTTRLPSSDPPSPAKWSPALAFYLRPDRMIPLNGIIGELSAQTTKGITDPLVKARKIYEYVIAHMRYDKQGTGWGRGDAVWACSSHRGNCTDFHSLFIGMARAAGVPARFRIGFPLPENAHQGAVEGYHCWAEFYLNKVGWVPIDAAYAWLIPARHNFYFGNLDPDRVMFTTGRDLRLAPAQHGETLNYFVYPYAELDGKPFSGIGHTFSFHDLSR